MSNAPVNKVAQLEQLVGSAPSSRLFTPDTFLRSDGTVSGQLKPQGAGFYGSISVATALLIIKNVEEFTQAAIDAVAMAKRPGEAERLATLKANREAKKKGAAPAPAARAATRAAELEAELASLQG
jgi:hypothetical protein